MTAEHIRAEHALARALTAGDIAAFLTDGVPPAALSWAACGRLAMLARDRVVFDASGRFEFARHVRDDTRAVNAFVVPLLGVTGEPADILAWRPAGQVGTWEGVVAVVGEEQLLASRIDEALDVHATVLDWLRAGRAGVVILDPCRAAATLEGSVLRTATAAHARQLRVALARPAPRIVLAKAAAGSRAA